MLNGWDMLHRVFRIILIFFIASSAWGQQQTDTISTNPMLLELQLKIIQEINASELRTRDRISQVLNHVNESERRVSDDVNESERRVITHVNDTFNDLNDKITSHEKDVALLNLKLNFLIWFLGAIVTVIILPLIFSGIKSGWQRLVNRESRNDASGPLNLLTIDNQQSADFSKDRGNIASGMGTNYRQGGESS